MPSGVRPGSTNTSWQEQLWTYYDLVGEFEYVANWVGNLLSKARLYPALNGKELTSGPAFDAVKELFGSEPGKSDALRMLGLHYTVAGESYIFTYKQNGEQVWEVVPRQVVGGDGKKGWTINSTKVPTNDLMAIRCWERHPRKYDEATSPSRSAIPILNEIVKLTQHIDAQVSSRLASAGILLLPNEITFSSASSKEGEDDASNQSSSDEFVDELIKVSATAISDRGDAAALVPIVLTADGEHLDKPRLLQFWTELDAHALELRTEAIRRLGLAMDVPPEILTGTGDVAHWQAWGVDEAAIKSHTEPLLARICSDLTAGYLWPSLKGEVEDDVLHGFTIEADTTAMRLRPNRSQEAIELYDRGLVKDDTVRRETGFEPSDKPTKTENELWLKRQLAKGSTTPEMVAAALLQLGVDVGIPTSEDETTETPQPPSLENHPDLKPVPDLEERDELDKDAKRKAEAAALVAAAEQMVFRALERGGSRIMNRTKFKPNNIEPPEVYLYRATTDAEASFMLDGSFEHCSRFAARFGVNPQALAATLDEYCRSLIMDRKPYNVDDLARRLEVMEVAHVG
jgi:hypothetical protein